MKKLTVCTVGVVLALLLGGVNNQASIKDDAIEFKPMGIVLDLAGATRWYIQGETYWFVPVPHLDLPQRPSIIDPMNPSNKLEVPERFIRRSLWFMDVGSKMLWGTLINSNQQEIKLVFIQRLAEDTYRVTIEDQEGRKLDEWEGGILHRLDPRIGYGVIEFQPSSSEINQEVILYDDGITVIRQELTTCICYCIRHCRTILWSLYCECTTECICECDGDIGP